MESLHLPDVSLGTVILLYSFLESNYLVLRPQLKTGASLRAELLFFIAKQLHNFKASLNLRFSEILITFKNFNPIEHSTAIILNLCLGHMLSLHKIWKENQNHKTIQVWLQRG